MDSIFSTKIRKYSFNNTGLNEIKCNIAKGQNWPIVYILEGEKEAYIGETNNAYKRMSQHLENPRRKVLDNIFLLLNGSFNKSVTLDFENKLIQCMHADGKYELQNENAGQSVQHDYYQRLIYEKSFEDLWNKLKRAKLVNKSYFDIINSDIFKYSPYKELTEDQYGCVEQMLIKLKEALETNSEKRMTICGGAGTGKTVLAIYFIKTIVDIINKKSDFSDSDELVPEDSPLYNSLDLIKLIKQKKMLNIALVIAPPSFRSTVKKVFAATKGLKSSMVIGPNEICKKDYDIVIVDEAHRLQRRNKLVSYGAYDNVSKSLDLPKESTQLEWIMAKKRPLTVIFYDPNQRVKSTDMEDDDFSNYLSKSDCIALGTQIRIKGGDEYVQFIKGVLNNQKMQYVSDGYDLTVFDDFGEMEK